MEKKEEKIYSVEGAAAAAANATLDMSIHREKGNDRDRDEVSNVCACSSRYKCAAVRKK